MERMIGKMKQMILCFLICMMGTSLLAGCGKPSADAGSAAAKQEDGGLKQVTLKIFLPGDEKSAKEEVLAAFEEYTKDTLNVKLEVHMMPTGDYRDKMMALISAGDNFDLCYAADWLLYPQMANKGAFYPLDGLLTEYAPTLYKMYEDMDYIDICSIDGQMMAMPWTTKKSSKVLWQYRSDLAEQYGIDVSNVSTIEDLDRVLTEAKQKIPDLIPIYASNSGNNNASAILSMMFAKYEMDRMDFHNFTIDLNSDSPALIPIEQTEMFRETVKWAKKWQDEGLMPKNELADSGRGGFKNGLAFSHMINMDSALTLVMADPGWGKDYIEIYPDSEYRLDSPLSNAIAVNKNAANPERAAMFMELLNTDQKAYDLFMYGIEGKTYVLDGDTVMYPEGEDPASPSYLDWFSWGFVRDHFDRPTQNLNTDIKKMKKEWLDRPNMVVSPAAGFMPDTNEIKTELSQREQLYTEYGKLLWYGMFEGDADAAVDKYIEQQKAAKLDVILDYLQPELDKYIRK